MPTRLLENPTVLTWIQRAYLVAVALCACMIVGFGWQLHNTNDRLADTQHKLAETQEKNAMLTQALCQSFSDSRVVSNKTIRAPLRETEYAIADIFAASAKAQKDPAIKSQIRALENKFRGYGNRVKDVGAVKCRFAS